MGRFDFVSKYSEEIYNRCTTIEKLCEDSSMLGYAYVEACNVIEMLMKYLGVLNTSYRLTMSSLAEQGKMPRNIENNMLLIMRIRNIYVHSGAGDFNIETENVNLIEMLEQICKWAFIFKLDGDSIDVTNLVLFEDQLSVLQKHLDQIGEDDLAAYILNFALNNTHNIKSYEYDGYSGNYQNLYNIPIKIDIFSGLKLLEETGFTMSIYEILDKAMYTILEIAEKGTNK